LSAKEQLNFQTVKNTMDDLQKRVPDEAKRDAITIWREAAGDPKVIQSQLDATKDKDLIPAYKAALNLTPEEKRVASEITDQYKALRLHAVRMGIDVAEVENYATHIWQKEPFKQSLPVTGGRSLRTSFDPAKPRVFPTYFHGEQLGYRAVSKDASKLLGTYASNLNRAIAAREFVADLAKAKEPDGSQTIAPNVTQGGLVTLENDKGKTVHVMPKNVKGEAFKDYKSLPVPAFQHWVWQGTDDEGKPVLAKSDMLIRPDSYGKLKNIFTQSAIREWWDSPNRS